VVVLLSTYDLGRQPFGLASPAAWLRREGIDVTCVDLSREKLDDETVARARLVGVYLPMHTATRLAVPVLDRVRRVNPSAAVAAFGLYATLNGPWLREHGVSHVLGPEFEADLVALAKGDDLTTGPREALPRLPFVAPDRTGLPAPARYASLLMPDGTRRVVGSTDATRGCKHHCRHCPIVPVYNGQFRVVPVEVVLADIRAQVGAGAEHITFADPDFLNGPAHARRIVESLHAEWPSVTYDVTIKIEHLLRHRDLLPVLARTGCAFVTSAVESVDDAVLGKLEKGHTRAGFVEAVHLCRQAGLTLAPTFVAFTPWTTLEGYHDLLETVDALDLVAHVAPVQWSIRLLVTWQSRLLELPDIRALVGAFDARTLTYPWRHTDPRVDALQSAVMGAVGVRTTRQRHEVFEEIRTLAEVPRRRSPALEATPSSSQDPEPGVEGAAGGRVARAAIPYLNEPWYC
jgi:radical SAM superfamily enzyme YgiQ (UPF0313 family)